MYPYKPEGGGYQPEDDGPEARMHRELSEQELADQATVERLIRALRPEDATMHIFSWTEMLRWGIPRRFRRI